MCRLGVFNYIVVLVYEGTFSKYKWMYKEMNIVFVAADRQHRCTQASTKEKATESPSSNSWVNAFDPKESRQGNE